MRRSVHVDQNSRTSLRNLNKSVSIESQNNGSPGTESKSSIVNRLKVGSKRNFVSNAFSSSEEKSSKNSKIIDLANILTHEIGLTDNTRA